MGEGPSGPVLSLQPDIGTLVSPDGAGTINVLGHANEIGFAQTYGLSNTLLIIPLFATATTSDATPIAMTPANANVFPTLTANQSYVMTANVIGQKSDFSAACGGFVTAVARKASSGSSVLVGNTPLINRDSMTGTPIFACLLSGDTFQVVVQGVVGETWNWTCTYQYQANAVI